MDRFEKLEAQLEFHTSSGERIAKFSPSASAMGQVCVALALLLHRLVARLILECSGRQVLNVTLDETVDDATAALGTWQPPTIRIRMSPTEVERWLVFALTYYRDGEGVVDHIDLDVRERSDGPSTIGVIFKVPSAATPMSPEELRKMLEKP